MKYIVLVTIILPKDQLTPQQQAEVPAHWRFGRKRLRVIVNADGEHDAIEIAKKAVRKKYPKGTIEIVRIV